MMPLSERIASGLAVLLFLGFVGFLIWGSCQTKTKKAAIQNGPSLHSAEKRSAPVRDSAPQWRDPYGPEQRIRGIVVILLVLAFASWYWKIHRRKRLSEFTPGGRPVVSEPGCAAILIFWGGLLTLATLFSFPAEKGDLTPLWFKLVVLAIGSILLIIGIGFFASKGWTRPP